MVFLSPVLLSSNFDSLSARYALDDLTRSGFADHLGDYYVDLKEKNTPRILSNSRLILSLIFTNTSYNWHLSNEALQVTGSPKRRRHYYDTHDQRHQCYVSYCPGQVRKASACLLYLVATPRHPFISEQSLPRKMFDMQFRSFDERSFAL